MPPRCINPPHHHPSFGFFFSRIGCIGAFVVVLVSRRLDTRFYFSFFFFFAHFYMGIHIYVYIFACVIFLHANTDAVEPTADAVQWAARVRRCACVCVKKDQKSSAFKNVCAPIAICVSVFFLLFPLTHNARSPLQSLISVMVHHHPLTTHWPPPTSHHPPSTTHYSPVVAVNGEYK